MVSTSIRGIDVGYPVDVLHISNENIVVAIKTDFNKTNINFKRKK